jgi:hypothetical protein
LIVFVRQVVVCKSVDGWRAEELRREENQDRKLQKGGVLIGDFGGKLL